MKVALGDLDKVVRVIRLGGFISSTHDFYESAAVMNGASDFMVEVFRRQGAATRSTTIGVASLPLPRNAAVEVEGMFEVS